MREVPLREARILWEPGGDVAIVGDGEDARRYDRLSNSGGACHLFWRKCNTEELYFRMLQTIWGLVNKDKIDHRKVHEAFLVVPEYRAILSPDQDEYLGHEGDDAMNAAERPTGFNSGGYPF